MKGNIKDKTYNRKDKGDGLNLDWVEVFGEDDTVCTLLAVKPCSAKDFRNDAALGVATLSLRILVESY